MGQPARLAYDRSASIRVIRHALESAPKMAEMCQRSYELSRVERKAGVCDRPECLDSCLGENHIILPALAPFTIIQVALEALRLQRLVMFS